MVGGRRLVSLQGREGQKVVKSKLGRYQASWLTRSEQVKVPGKPAQGRIRGRKGRGWVVRHEGIQVDKDKAVKQDTGRSGLFMLWNWRLSLWFSDSRMETGWVWYVMVPRHCPSSPTIEGGTRVAEEPAPDQKCCEQQQV